MPNKNLSKFLPALVLIGSISCAVRNPQLLYTYENQSDLNVLRAFPHNNLGRKTSIEAAENEARTLREGNVDWNRFKSMTAPGDEVWTWVGNNSVPRRSFDKEGATKAGYCLLRKGKVIAIFDCFTVEVIQ